MFMASSDRSNDRMDEKWMRIAMQEAALAADAGEVPIGAVIVQGETLIAQAHNRCERDGDATAHAECLAISEACRTLGRWRLSDCTLYVTLEPCPMCAGAAVNARIPRVVFAAKDPRMGACGSVLNLSSYPLEITPLYQAGVMAEESLALLRQFFEALRKKKNQ